MAPGLANVASIVMHPNFLICPSGSGAAAISETMPSGSSAQPAGHLALGGFSPQQILNAYGISQTQFGTIQGDGTGQTIAIVDAYDDPGLVSTSSAAFSSSDLAQFDRQFGLPDPPSFTKLGQDGSTNLPGTDSTHNWEIEESLDVEWAHAIAPAASIVLVECNSATFQDLVQTGVRTAADLPGVSVVSMSFGSSEFASESYYDTYFTTPSGHQGVTFVASTGDSGAPGGYPAVSANVVAVGGTSLTLNAESSYQNELGWSGSGGGPSTYESKPSFQQNVQSSSQRTIPDVAFDANPSTGVAVYDSFAQSNPWLQVGGTSLAAPCWGGIVAIADQGRVAAGVGTLDGPGQTLPALYSLSSADFHDVTSGSNGYQATAGYDMVTGIGSPKANLLVGNLATYQLASRLAVTSQLPSSLTAGAQFSVSVAVLDAAGNAVTSYKGTVTISLAAGPAGSGLSGTCQVTVANGVGSFSSLWLDTAGSGYALQISGSGLTSATITGLSVTPAAASQLVITGQPPASVTAGTPFGLQVAVEDSYGNLETGDTGQVSLSLVSGPSGAMLGGTSSVTAASGVAGFENLWLDAAGGNNVIVASSGALASAPCQSMTVTPGPVARLAVTSPPPASIAAGARFAMGVALYDAYGNLETGNSSTVNVAIGSGPSGAALGGLTSQTADQGTVSFSGLVIDVTGSYQLKVTGGGLTASSAPSLIVQPGSPAELTISGMPAAPLAAGNAFGLSVTALDAFGNVETSMGGSVSLTLTGGTTGAVLVGSRVVTFHQGAASFSGLAIDLAGNGYALAASGAGLTATTGSFSVAAGTASRLVLLSQPPATVVAGGNFGFAVQVQDAWGNIAAGTGGTLMASLAANPAGDWLSGDVSVPVTAGVATFTSLELSHAVSGDTILVSGAGLSSVTTRALTVTPAAASHFVMITQPPSSVTAGVPFGLAVAAEDPFGNLVPGCSVTAALAANPSAAALQGPVSVTASQGVAAFTSLSILKAGGPYTIAVSSAGLAPVAMGLVGVTPAAASRLVLTTGPPATVTVGSSFRMVAAVEDAYGNVVAGYGGSVTAAVPGVHGKTPLRGTLVEPISGGVATFPGLSLNKVGKGYIVTLSARNLPAAATAPFSVTLAPRVPAKHPAAHPVQVRKARR